MTRVLNDLNQWFRNVVAPRCRWQGELSIVGAPGRMRGRSVRVVTWAMSVVTDRRASSSSACRLPLVFLLVVVAGLPGRVSADTVWLATGTGALAGDWFQASNWLPAIYPAETDDVVINNGGEARADIAAAIGIVEGNRIQVGHNGGMGVMTNQGVKTTVVTSVNIGTIQDLAGSAQANSLGSATWSDIAHPNSIGTDLRVGRNISLDDAVTTNAGTLTIDRIDSLLTGGDFDIGQTAHGGAPSVGGIAQGTGTVTIRDVVGAVTVGNALEIGRTSAVSKNTAHGRGTFNLLRASSLSVAADLSVGQVSGNGQSEGTGFATIRNVPSVTVGGNIDVGRSGASSTKVNTGNGTATISDATISVGFTSPTLPGNVNVGRSILAGVGDAAATGLLAIERSHLQVAGRTIVGQLSGGVGKSTSSAVGSLLFVDSLATTPALDVGLKLGGALGTVSGFVEMNSSLLQVNGTMTLGSASTLIFDLGGKTRANGSGGGGQYGAVDATAAVLDGVFQVNLVNGFAPTIGDTFSVLSFGSKVGDFASYQGLDIGAHLTLAPSFVGNALNLRAEPVLPGDINLDGVVDIFDVNVVSDHWGEPGPQGDANFDGVVDIFDINMISDAWLSGGVGAATVPEPASWLLASIVLLLLRCQLPSRLLG